MRNTLLRSLVLGAAMVVMFGGACSATTYASWVMMWYGRDQAWWSPNNADGAKNLVRGEWKTLDWCDNDQIDAHLDSMKAAGVTVVIGDLTNGWGWLDARCQYIQSLCAKKGMKFCVAENSGGNTVGFESHAKDIWDRFAGPDAPNHETYFHYRGKPLIVCYAVRDWYKSYLKQDTPCRNKFSLVWTSGEDSSINKWGWQLEPWIGAIPSDDSMFVTSSVRWNPGDATMWRKSLAWLDYNFALARKNNPKYVVIGSYDDPTERNAWLVSDTSHCHPAAQMRDATGALNHASYYDRVKQWTSGKVSTVPGGLLKDGAYRIVSRAAGKPLGIFDDKKLSRGTPGSALVASERTKAPIGLFWLYHIGKNQYRIISLSGGLALEAAKDKQEVIQNWDSPEANQRWTLAKASKGYFKLTNNATAKALALNANAATEAPAQMQTPAKGAEQEWKFEAVLTL